LVDFVALKPCGDIDGNLTNNIIMLFEAKGFSDSSFHTMLVAVVGCCSEAYAKLLFDKVCKQFWLFEHQPIGFVD
jgi:hypothetical protein